MDALGTKTVHMPAFEPLGGNVKTDVLIIGGGIAGLLCAYYHDDIVAKTNRMIASGDAISVDINPKHKELLQDFRTTRTDICENPSDHRRLC